MKKVIVSTSGGKDSTFACFKAMQQGYKVSYLANTISDDYKRVRFHGLPAELIQAQAQAMQIPLIQKETSANNYRRDYLDNLKKVIKKDISGLVLGDIYLQDCYDWAEEICKELNIELIEPLWQIPSKKIIQDFIESGFEAVVVSTQSNLLGKEWVGRKVDPEFLNDIEKLKKIDICGENGEFHTFVTSGPTFKKRIILKDIKKVLIGGYWFLDIQSYSLK